MPNSLKCKIKHLCHNGTITERERDRILEALENEPYEDATTSDRRERMKLLIEIPEEYYNEMKNTSVWWSGLKKCVLNGKPLDDVLDEIRADVPVTPKPKTGKWIMRSKAWKEYYVCSACGYGEDDELTQRTKFCPNCGAKMEGESE